MEGSGETAALGVAGRATSHFITFARIPIARLEPTEGQRSLIPETVDGIYEDLTENNVGMRDIHPLGVILTREGNIQSFKRWLVTQKSDTVLSFEGIPEEYRFKVFSGNHRTAAVTRYLEAHQNDTEPPSAVMSSWLCAVYDADLADDPDLPILMVAHNVVGHHSAASTRQWISGLQSCGESAEKIKSTIALTADASLVHNLCIVRKSALWESLAIYGSNEFNTSLTLPIIASWAGYFAEFEILGLLLRDGVRQQEHIASFKKTIGKPKKPLTPVDIFGKVWGRNGHKQSGDYENVKKDWKMAKIRGFGSSRVTFSFHAFWNEATADKDGNEYVFGKVILVPEDLRGDPKGGKRKDMVGYVILRQARCALSCLATLLFAGNFDYRCRRAPRKSPDPWVATIMRKAGVEENNIEELIRYMVPRLSELVPDWTLHDLPHEFAHSLLKSDHGEDVLSQMVWPALMKGDCYTAWDEFLSHCEDQFKLARNGEFWDMATTMKNVKSEPKTGLRHISTPAPEAYVTSSDDDDDMYFVKEPAAKRRRRGSKQPRYRDVSSSESEVVVVTKTRRAAQKQIVAEDHPSKRPLAPAVGPKADVDMAGYAGGNLGRVDSVHDTDPTLTDNSDDTDDQGYNSEDFTDSLMALVEDKDDDEMAGEPQESGHPTTQVSESLPFLFPNPVIQQPNSSPLVQRNAANQASHSSSLIPPSGRWASSREQAVSQAVSYVSATNLAETSAGSPANHAAMLHISPITTTQGAEPATQAISNYAGNRMVLDLPHVHVTVPMKRKREASGMGGDQRLRTESTGEAQEHQLLRQRADEALARIEIQLDRRFEEGHGNMAVALLEALENSLATASFESSI